ncbi:MAG TPA: nuclear transport factor 2 family protein [Chthoniobacterales bacterium]|nr:nuclear transport factor 2 family protein [Chthoniobacterales bacterium]
MKKYFSLAVTVWFASIILAVAATPDKDAIMAKEKEAWQAFKDKNADAFKKVVDKDFRGVYAEGIVNLDQELAEMKTTDMKSFAISDFTSFSDEKDVIVTTYKCAIQSSNGGKDTSGTYNCGTVWKMENNVWMAIFHTNAKAETAK